MAIDADKLDQEADAEYARLMGMEPQAPVSQQEQDKPTDQNPTADDVPPPPSPVEPEALTEPPAPVSGDDWQDKYTKAEESRKNAHALMTQATQKAADLERSNSELQQHMATLQAQVNLLSQQQSAPQTATQAPTDQFQELREDYQELGPVFSTLDEAQRKNQALEQRLAAIEQARQQQDKQQAEQAFWAEVEKTHPDVRQLAASTDFQGWFSRQNAGIKELSQVNPTGAATVMTLYKQSAGLHSPSQKIEQAQQLSEPQVRSHSRPQTQGRQPALTPEQIAALPQKEYEKNEEKYDEMLAYWMKQGGRL